MAVHMSRYYTSQDLVGGGGGRVVVHHGGEVQQQLLVQRFSADVELELGGDRDGGSSHQLHETLGLCALG